MGYAVAITDTDGTRRTYNVPDFGELTIAEWKRLCIPTHDAQGVEAVHEDLKRLTGIPLKHLRRLSVEQVEQLTNAYIALREQAAKRQAEVDETNYANPERITHDGITYVVPKDIDKEGTYGQWLDLQVAIDGATHEPEVMAAICACLLVEEGKEYEGFHKTLERFDTLPVRVAMGLTAFFFGSSERLANAISQSLTRRAMSLQPASEQEAQPLMSDTASGVN